MNPTNEQHVYEKLRPGFDFYRRHEEKFATGTPDIEFGYDGHFGWLEAKFVRGRKTKLLSLGLRPAQIGDITQRHDAGQFVCVVAYFECVSEYFLFFPGALPLTHGDAYFAYDSFVTHAWCHTADVSRVHTVIRSLLIDF